MKILNMKDLSVEDRLRLPNIPRTEQRVREDFYDFPESIQVEWDRRTNSLNPAKGILSAWFDRDRYYLDGRSLVAERMLLWTPTPGISLHSFDAVSLGYTVDFTEEHTSVYKYELSIPKWLKSGIQMPGWTFVRIPDLPIPLLSIDLLETIKAEADKRLYDWVLM